MAAALQRKGRLGECMAWMERGLSLTGSHHNPPVLLDAAAVIAEALGDASAANPGHQVGGGGGDGVAPAAKPLSAFGRLTGEAHARYRRAIELTEASIEASLGLRPPGRWAELLLGCSRGDPTSAMAVRRIFAVGTVGTEPGDRRPWCHFSAGMTGRSHCP